MCTAGLKKTDDSVDNTSGVFELDELYWFIERKPRTETRRKRLCPDDGEPQSRDKLSV